jgi:MFS family permease
MWITLNIPNENTLLFSIMLAITAIFIPIAAPNVISSVYDVTLPEVRSTALSIQYFIESAGAALSPLMVGIIADQSSLKNAFLIICIFTWVLCAIFFLFTARVIPKDIKVLREEMQARAALNRSSQA